MIMLLQFLLRLAFGLAAGMAMTSPRQVTSGYYRNHLYVVLGLTTLAALLSRSVAPTAFWWILFAAIASYVGSVFWLYEKPRDGWTLLVMVALFSLMGAFEVLEAQSIVEVPGLEFFESNSLEPAQLAHETLAMMNRTLRIEITSVWLRMTNTISSGLLLGITMASMLLGHWYLNSPMMDLAPLRRLILALACAVALQAFVSILGLWGAIACGQPLTTQWVLFLVLRWTFGLLGVGVMAWMAWQTLKIPNTQSTTGILYVAVIGTFVGETMALLLSAESVYPL